MNTTAIPTLRRRAAALLAAMAGACALAGMPAQSDAYTLHPQVQRPFVDLTTAKPGEFAVNQVRIKNLGNSASGGFYVRITAGGVTKSLQYVSSLAAGATKEISSSSIGTYGHNCGIAVTVDATNAVTERDESNNWDEGYCIR